MTVSHLTAAFQHVTEVLDSIWSSNLGRFHSQNVSVVIFSVREASQSRQGHLSIYNLKID